MSNKIAHANIILKLVRTPPTYEKGNKYTFTAVLTIPRRII